MKLLADEQYERLKTVPKTTGRTLQGAHSYDILANPLYLDDFQYVDAAEEDRAELIVDDEENEVNDCRQSDSVKMMINLAYLTESQAKNFRFSSYKAIN